MAKNADLRQRAEEIAREKAAAQPPPEDHASLSPEEIRQAFHELRVHQIELEMQNEELRRTQAELEDARARYFDLYDLAPVGYVTLSEKGLILEANLTAAGLLGMTRGALVGQRLSHFIFKEDEDRYYLYRKRLFGETAKPQVWEVRLLKADGTPFWARLEASAGQDASGARLARIALSDISERKGTEAALHETQVILQAAMDQSQVGIAIADAPSGVLRYVNDAGLLIRGGYRDSVVNGVGIDQYVASWQLMDLDGRPLPGDEVPLARAILFGETGSREFIIRRTNDDDRIVLANATPIRDDNGRITAGIVFFLDVTERKKAEAALLQSNERLALAQRSAGAGMWDWDIVTGKLNWSLELFHLFGLDPAQTQATFNACGAILHPDDAQMAGERINAAIRDHTPLFNEYRILTPAGETRWINVWGNTIYNQRGEAQRMSGICIDISERKQAQEDLNTTHAELRRLLEASDQSRQVLLGLVEDQKESEEQIRRLNAELEQRVAERTAQLTVANQELEAFSYSVSHDLRGPLRAMDGFSAVLLSDYQAQLDAEGQHYLTLIQNASRRMGQLIEDLLNLSRITRREIALTWVDLSSVARQVADELLAQQALAPQRKIEFEIAPDLRARMDYNLLKIALENLGTVQKSLKRGKNTFTNSGTERCQD